MTREEIVLLLDELGERLDGPARYAFDLALRQVYVQAVMWVVVLAVIAVFAAVFLWWIYRKAQRDDDPYSEWIIPLVMGSVLAVVILPVAAVYALSKVAQALLNPEWAALQSLLDLWP